MTYKGVKIPKLNGRAQLWYRGDYTNEYGDTISGMRIIYATGLVHYTFDMSYKTLDEPWDNGCTSKFTQFKAIKACIDYSLNRNYKGMAFLGYL